MLDRVLDDVEVLAPVELEDALEVKRRLDEVLTAHRERVDCLEVYHRLRDLVVEVRSVAGATLYKRILPAVAC
jgi:hypothetical protein